MNIVSHKGKTALHNAVFKNSFDVAKPLVSNGARVDIQDRNGKTAMDQAVALKGRGDIIMLLSVNIKQD